MPTASLLHTGSFTSLLVHMDFHKLLARDPLWADISAHFLATAKPHSDVAHKALHVRNTGKAEEAVEHPVASMFLKVALHQAQEVLHIRNTPEAEEPVEHPGASMFLGVV